MENHDEAGSEIHGFVLFEEHAGNNVVNSMKKAVKERAVFEEKMPEVFVNGKNAMAVLDIYQLKRHTGSAFHGIFISAGRAETAVAAERDKFKFSTVGAAIHSSTEGRITTVNHLIDIFDFSISGVKSIFNFFIMVSKDFL